MNNKAFDKLDYSLALLSALHEDKRYGCIINSLHQVTSSYPAKFTITVNRDNATCAAVKQSGHFSVTLLAADCPEELINHFGYKSSRALDKFAAYTPEKDELGAPYLTEHMASRISCTVTGEIEIGNYILFVGQATEAEVLSDDPVLTVQAFTDRGKTVPPQSTVYRTVEVNGYRCTVCGYVYEGESLPADYRCPICGAPAEKFEKIEK